MFANMVSSLILHDRIETTLPKAKELRRVADRLVTLGKRKTLHARRHAVAMIKNKKAVSKVFGELAERFAERNGGYTRIYKLGFRHGDSAPMAVIEYLPAEYHKEEAGAPAKKPKPKAKAKSKAKAEKKHVEKRSTKKAKKHAAKKAGAAKAKKEKKRTKKTTKKAKTSAKRSTKSK